MSVTKASRYRLKTSIFSDGERRAFLVDEHGVPEPYSTLYVTMRLRNAGKSVSTQEAHLNSINILLMHAEDHRLALYERFKNHSFLNAMECEALRLSVQQHRGPAAKSQFNVLSIKGGKNGHIYRGITVKPAQQHSRFAHIASYLQWLWRYLPSTESNEKITLAAHELERMVRNILALRPMVATMGSNVTKPEFTRAHYAVLANAITPGNGHNPFNSGVQLRNQLIVKLMAHLGERRGGILNLRVGDINFGKSQINIVRRADSKEDPRIQQPRVKTREHTLPVGPVLMDLLRQYLDLRRSMPSARKHPYLLVTHKSGPTLGKPMTIPGLNQVFKTINNAVLGIPMLHPHLLRHFFHTQLAEEQLSQPTTSESRETDRRVRNELAGRRPDSVVDAIYTKRAIEREAITMALKVQSTLGNSDASTLSDEPLSSPPRLPKN